MDKKIQLKRIVKSCEIRFNRGSSENWKHSDFSDFSREIQKKTKITISTNTLKRIFGKISVDDYYLPQRATIDALVEYSGYDFKDENEEETDDLNERLSDASSRNPWSIFVKYRFILVFLVCLLVVFGLYVCTREGEQNLAVIKIVKSEGNLPKTVFFQLDVTKSKDSMFVDFGDKSPAVYLEPKQRTISHVYLFPGVFSVNLKGVTDITLAKTKTYVPSNKWLGLGYFRQREIPNAYYAFPAAKQGKDSLFHISSNLLQKVGLDTSQVYYTRLCNFSPIDSHSDNFVFETTFRKMVEEKGIYCSSMQFQISGIDNFIRFNFVSSGCSSKTLNVISEQSFHGLDKDLSKFVLDLEKWNTIKLINRGKKLELYVNNKLRFQTQYKESIGNLRGVFVEFKGNGYVKKCNLSSLKGEKLLEF